MATPPASASSEPHPPDTSPPPAGSFPRRLRLIATRDFHRVMRQGVRVVDRRLVIWALPNALGLTRLGLTVGRRHGGAVQRNRVKRVLREAFRLARERLPAGFDLVVSPHPGPRLTLADAIESLARLAAGLPGRLRPRKGAGPRAGAAGDSHS
jgi:ribonuclease P protein component